MFSIVLLALQNNYMIIMKNEYAAIKKIIALIFILTLFIAFRKVPHEEIRNELRKYFDQANVNGSFILYDEKQDAWTFCNKDQFHEKFLPASTFKICNSLIGLETGVIKDENFTIPWDSVVRPVTKWNKDHDLKTAFKNSTVWYYQELARRVGGAQMKYWLDKVSYGNADTSGWIDHFWLTGGLRISPAEQIAFLKKLKNDQLPFSRRSMSIVKKIMIAKDTLNCVVRAKTGWADGKPSVGWYVGYVENKNGVYYFSTCIQSNDPGQTFAEDRIRITYKILNELKIINF